MEPEGYETREDREARREAEQKAQVKKYIKWGIWAFVALIALITFFGSLATIGTGKVGVVTSYGRVTGRELTEGISWVAPWGVNSVTEYDTKTQKVQAEATASTKDLQDVNATVVLTYALNRGKVSEVHQEVGKDFQAIEIDPQVQEAFKAVSAKYTASELITNRAEVKKAVVDNLKERVENKGRYNIQDVAITEFKFSVAFNQAIEAVQIANQKIAQARQELETTKVEAEKQVAEATAQAESQRLRQQTLTKEILDQQWIAKWNGVLPTTQAGANAQLYIPTR